MKTFVQSKADQRKGSSKVGRFLKAAIVGLCLLIATILGLLTVVLIVGIDIGKHVRAIPYWRKALFGAGAAGFSILAVLTARIMTGARQWNDLRPYARAALALGCSGIWGGMAATISDLGLLEFGHMWTWLR